MWARNSSVTWDKATSVTSSCLRAIRLSSRSNGPSKTSRWTWNEPVAFASAASTPTAVSASVTVATLAQPAGGGGATRHTRRARRTVGSDQAKQGVGDDVDEG